MGLDLLNEREWHTKTNPSIRCVTRGLTGAQQMVGYRALVRKYKLQGVEAAEFKLPVDAGDLAEDDAEVQNMQVACFFGWVEWTPEQCKIKGQPMRPDDMVERWRLVKALPLDYLIEIAGEITNDTEMRGDREKNSASRSKSPSTRKTSTARRAKRGTATRQEQAATPSIS